ncbi:hypothetical protein ANN_03460 [Periplaneta americana]|uniref:Uncharacterized protein n=1 Tax=Periplaneta americana TaxID=6978 RepID=A0ABQ8TZ06_PERAM|nr:hypothetical protein ANN_03460 [Periplaneta americana]
MGTIKMIAVIMELDLTDDSDDVAFQDVHDNTDDNYEVNKFLTIRSVLDKKRTCVKRVLIEEMLYEIGHRLERSPTTSSRPCSLAGRGVTDFSDKRYETIKIKTLTIRVVQRNIRHEIRAILENEVRRLLDMSSGDVQPARYHKDVTSNMNSEFAVQNSQFLLLLENQFHSFRASSKARWNRELRVQFWFGINSSLVGTHIELLRMSRQFRIDSEPCWNKPKQNSVKYASDVNESANVPHSQYALLRARARRYKSLVNTTVVHYTLTKKLFSFPLESIDFINDAPANKLYDRKEGLTFYKALNPDILYSGI